MPEKDTETEEGQAHCTHVERHIAVPDRNNTVIFTFEGDSKLGCFSLKNGSAHPVQKTLPYVQSCVFVFTLFTAQAD